MWRIEAKVNMENVTANIKQSIKQLRVKVIPIQVKSDKWCKIHKLVLIQI